MWELDHKEDWAPTNCCFQIVVLEKTRESPLDSREIQPADALPSEPPGKSPPKGNQLWIFVGRTDAEAEAPILGQLMQRANSPEKTQMLGRIEAKGEEGSKELDH